MKISDCFYPIEESAMLNPSSVPVKFGIRQNRQIVGCPNGQKIVTGFYTSENSSMVCQIFEFTDAMIDKCYPAYEVGVFQKDTKFDGGDDIGFGTGGYQDIQSQIDLTYSQIEDHRRRTGYTLKYFQSQYDGDGFGGRRQRLYKRILRGQIFNGSSDAFVEYVSRNAE